MRDSLDSIDRRQAEILQQITLEQKDQLVADAHPRLKELSKSSDQLVAFIAGRVAVAEEAMGIRYENNQLFSAEPQSRPTQHECHLPPNAGTFSSRTMYF